jgi:hypothetical protein
MMLVSLVLKLFVSSRPLKLEGVLCIYVLLSMKDKLKTICMFFLMIWKHVWLSLFYFHDLLFVFICMFTTWLLSFLLSWLYLHANVLSSYEPSSQMLTYMWSRLCRCMSPQKLFFCYHLPTRGQAGVRLGDAWYISNVSIIFYAPCLFLHHLPIVLLHFVALLCIFRN